eukprot:scaffold26472_cov120-Isochrysis_galbana.AAC.1
MLLPLPPHPHKYPTPYSRREAALGIKLAPGAYDRLAAYGRAVSHFPTAVKEFHWRNGWFHDISRRAVAEGRPDPTPLHTAGLVQLGIVDA